MPLAALVSDGMTCFARVATNATAIEMDHHYCRKLVQRQKKAGSGPERSPLATSQVVTQAEASGRFAVVCNMYERVPRAVFAAADYVTWWIGGLKMNTQVLRHLPSMRTTLRPNIEAIIVHDLHTGIVNAPPGPEFARLPRSPGAFLRPADRGFCVA